MSHHSTAENLIEKIHRNLIKQSEKIDYRISNMDQC